MALKQLRAIRPATLVGDITALAALGAPALPAAAQSAPTIKPRWAPSWRGVGTGADLRTRWQQEFPSPFRVLVRAELRGRGTDCDALAPVSAARDARHSALPDDLNGLTATRLYPATLWIGVSDEAAARLARPGFSLAAATGLDPWQPAGRALQLETADQSIRLAWLARGDFNHDGWEDALYRWQGAEKGGTWSDVRLVLLTRHADAAPLVELPLPLKR